MAVADLTVVVPNFNHARFLPRSLGAIVTQSIQPREVLVIDDASSDDSVRIINEFAAKHTSIRLIRNERNCGVVPNINRGLALAAGRYVTFCSADDYMLPGYFEKLIEQLERHPQAALAFSYDSFQIDHEGTPQPNPDRFPHAGFFSPDAIASHLERTIPGHSVILRTEPLRAIGGFDAGLAWYCDWFAHLVLAFRHGACHVPEMLSVRVLMDENYSASKPRERHLPVLQRFFHLLTTDCADVAPLFQRYGGATHFGTDLIRAAATRPDVWSQPILGFLNGFTDDEYRELLDDADPAVRAIASFFLGPFWRRDVEQRRAAEAERRRLEDELEEAKRRLPPPGATGKLRWLAGLVAKRLRRAG
jgi:glycosyltransferase involved in cell wall biosynthesis